MGLTTGSTGIKTLKEMLDLDLHSPNDLVIALAGNPNTGKSTVFNRLTGLNQHTGNWTGKTVTTAQGTYHFQEKDYVLVDLPGTYSLLSSSVEEEIARDFICFGQPNATIVVTDATCLERNLNLVLQILEITDKVVVCVNLLDEAKKKNIHIYLDALEKKLGVPVVGTSARSGKGLKELMHMVKKVAQGEVLTHPVQIKYNDNLEEVIDIISSLVEQESTTSINSRWIALKLLDGDKTIWDAIQKHSDLTSRELLRIREAFTQERQNLRDQMVESIVQCAEEISLGVVESSSRKEGNFDRKIDGLVTSKLFGIPFMLLLLGMIFWITIVGANYPSKAIASVLFSFESMLTDFFTFYHLPVWLHGALVLGIYRTLAWVISVMLPPMAIFFPLFTLLEDLGYLPRVAFNLDNYFKKACAHGKQALTMCMGFGCNAAGVVGCRIIDSPRERLIATITNFFVPCNGRFPTLITITTLFIAGAFTGPLKSVVATLTVTGMILLGVVMTLIVSKLLSKTLLKGVPSSFTLELPPYRAPQIGRVIVRSLFDRTLFVLGRAILIAAPAGLLIWLMANVQISGTSLLDYGAGFFQPLGKLLGMDGYILLAFILGIPANEIVMPIIIMSYLSAGSMLQLDNLSSLREVLVANGWTWLTAVNVMLFCLMHFPCATTLLTIHKETKSLKWTVISFLIPTVAGVMITFLLTQLVRLITLLV